MKKHALLFALSMTLLSACQPSTQIESDNNTAAPEKTDAAGIDDLPIAISNNAVAIVSQNDEFQLFSFYGLREGRTWRDITRDAFAYDSGTSQWQRLPDLPDKQGRLASVAAAVDGNVYILGGYTVAENGDEVSTPEVWKFSPSKNNYQAMPNIPLPVDDSVALVYQDRWIILVSGWHKDANVDKVQIFDTQSKQWSETDRWPGAPVFGHAAALHNNQMIVCDGVRLDVSNDGKRNFSASNECWRGQISETPTIRIQWQQMPAHPGKPRYRMGASTIANTNLAAFAGGSENPYNYNGIGYNKIPSEPSNVVDYFDFNTKQWRKTTTMPTASMDHRGLLCRDAHCYLIGGMRSGQKVSADINTIAVQQ
jgi:N-acetylneuraminic acid mutarotase